MNKNCIYFVFGLAQKLRKLRIPNAFFHFDFGNTLHTYTKKHINCFVSIDKLHINKDNEASDTKNDQKHIKITN